MDFFVSPRSQWKASDDGPERMGMAETGSGCRDCTVVVFVQLQDMTQKTHSQSIVSI
jgi:hypothetical protein